MNIMKKMLSLALAGAVLLIPCGCAGDAQAERPYDLNLEEYVTVGEYTGIAYSAFQVDVTDAEVDAAIDKVLEEYVEKTQVLEGTVKPGDYVNIRYTMEVDGQTIEGADQLSYTIKIGDSGLMADVEHALTGAQVGDCVTVETAFPDDYDINPEYAGKSVYYEITVQHIVIPEFPELTDAFASEHFGTKTADEYRELMRQSLYETELAEKQYAAGEEIWAKVVAAAEVIQYPEKEVEEKELQLTESFKSVCEQNGMTFEEALEDLLNMDQETFQKEMRTSAEAGVKEEMVLYAIAREHDLEMSEKEIQAYLDDMLAANKMTSEEFAEEYGVSIREYAQNSGVLISMLYQDVFAFLVEQGSAV